ncbi:MAG: 2-oxoglutarate dehydrogenase complex dihydrolipoyllysine-residue succinyltransferase [Verrucomicrobiales bacterium]|nr:2-oxoglutarate dehydrogenase complex dihydrolipoyllysine-residue succinyltransferase [Verrucomicrobiales bacterium]
MAHELKIPSVGESITSATIAEWHKGDGQYVRAGEEVLTIETDKVSQSLEAQVSGKLTHIAAEGDEVDIGAIVATIDESAEAPPEAAGDPKPATTASAAPAAAKTVTVQRDSRATSVATNIAADKGIDLATVKGSGPRGKITKEDVLSAGGGQAAEKRFTRKKMTPLRRKIADHLVNAQQNAAILTTFNECDMSSIMATRKRVQDEFVEKHGVKLGFMSFFLKAVVEGLQEVPSINGRIEGDEIIQNQFYDIGVAVGTEKGLVVPVIRDVDKKSFAEIEQDIIDYATKAREGKIQLADLLGGVFTVTNGGIYGSLLSTPIINPPQSGILGMHTIQQRPVAVDGEVVIRPMMYLALSYDHRIVDGKEAVTFLVKVKECLEEPEAMMMGLV